MRGTLSAVASVARSRFELILQFGVFCFDFRRLCSAILDESCRDFCV
jgi:hypothetical protein